MVVGWMQKLQEKEWNNEPEISELVGEMGKKSADYLKQRVQEEDPFRVAEVAELMTIKL